MVTSCSPTTRGRASSSSTACNFHRPRRDSVSDKRYLLLAEGKSGDAHYGKTARGVMRYAPEKVAAVLDTERAGETEQGFPVVGSVNDSLCFNPTTALVGGAAAGGPLPPGGRPLPAGVPRADPLVHLERPRRRERAARVPDARSRPRRPRAQARRR